MLAVDTRDRRFSMLGFGKPFGAPYVLPNPEGGFDVDDRAQLLCLYRGIALSSPGGEVEAGSENYLFRRRRADRR